MTMNGLIALMLRYFTAFDILGAPDYVTVVENRPIRFGAEYPLPVMFWPKIYRQEESAGARKRQWQPIVCASETCCPLFYKGQEDL